MRKFIIIALILGLLGATATGGRRVYRQWKTHRALSAAKAALAKSDYNNAGLWLRKAVSANGNNIEAVRTMGNFAELIQTPAAVFWRQRLVDLEPNSATNLLLLARAALVVGDYATANTALNGVKEADRNMGEYHKTRAAFSVATGQLEEGEKHFVQVIKIEPNNAMARLNLGVIRLQRRDPGLAQEGREILNGLRTNATVRVDALRHLIADSLRHTNHAQALRLSAELVGESNALINDRILRLDVLQAARDPLFSVTLAGLQRSCLTNAQEVFTLSRWMLNATGPEAALSWLNALAPQIRTNLPVTMVITDAYVGLARWVELQSYVSKQDWGELDYLRRTFSSRAFREQGLVTAAKAEWSKALKGAEGRRDRLGSLERVAVGWRWLVEMEEVLWIIVTKFPSEKGPAQALSNLLYASGKTRSLLTLYAHVAKNEAGNLALKNNLASVALLLGAEEYRPHELAREVYEKRKDNPIFVSTYAFSLHLQNRTKEALQLMGQLKPAELDQPDIAGYYGIMLAARGESAKARRYLELAANGRLLPEEKELFRRVNRQPELN